MKKKIKKFVIYIFAIYIGLSAFMNLKGLIKYYVYKKAPSSEWTPQMGDKLEVDYSSVFWGKMQYVNLNGLFKKMLHQREMNGVTKLNNGWLASIDNDSSTDKIIENVQSLKQLNDYLGQKNIEFLFVVTPDTVCKYNNQLPEGVIDYTNAKLDVFVEQLERENVNYIDLRESMYEDGINQYDLFYKTDHHWNVRGGMYAAKKIIESAEEIFQEDIDESIVDIDNYQSIIYSKWHLGSKGQRVGRYFAGIDDFEILIPDFDTQIQRLEDGESGNFKEIFINETALINRNYESRYTYDTTYNCIGKEYINTYAACERKIQLVSDSMGRVVVPFLSLAFKDIGSNVYELVSLEKGEEQPDMVVMLLHPMNVFGEDYFKFDL